MAKKYLLGRVESDRINMLDPETPLRFTNLISKAKKPKLETKSFIPSLNVPDLKDDEKKKGEVEVEVVQVEDLNLSSKNLQPKPSTTETTQQRRLQWNRKSQRIRDAEKNRNYKMEKQLIQLEKQHITLQVRLRQLELEKQVFTSFFTRQITTRVNPINTLYFP